MWTDPIVEELRKAREELAARFGGDVHAFFECVRERERESGDEYIVLKPNAPGQEGER